AAFGEMGMEQRLPDAVCVALARGQPQQPVRGQRRHAHLVAVEIERQAHGARRGLGAGQHLRGALGATELPCVGLAQRHRLGAGIGIEQEGMPVHLELRRLGAEQFQAALEAALADPAPGADHVGPDIDSHATVMGAGRTTTSGPLYGSGLGGELPFARKRAPTGEGLSSGPWERPWSRTLLARKRAPTGEGLSSGPWERPWSRTPLARKRAPTGEGLSSGLWERPWSRTPLARKRAPTGEGSS